jgi:hypothetical protein
MQELNFLALKFVFNYYKNIWKYIIWLSLKLQNVDYRFLIRFWGSSDCTEYTEQKLSVQTILHSLSQKIKRK